MRAEGRRSYKVYNQDLTLMNCRNLSERPPGRDARRGTALLQGLSSSLMALRQVSQRHIA
jgi:hypothetical protein